jgi:hypothetical protein
MVSMSQSLLTAAKWRRTGDLSSELFSISSGRSEDSEVLQLMLKQHGIGMQMSYGFPMVPRASVSQQDLNGWRSQNWMKRQEF